jgi:hypothetical protein
MRLTSLKFYFHGVLPFVPVIVGISLKFALIDQPGTDVGAYVFNEYVRPAWIEFLVTAYVTGVAAAELRKSWISLSSSHFRRFVLLSVWF